MTDDWDRLLQDAHKNPSNEQQERDALDQAILDCVNSNDINKVVDSLLDIEMSDEEANDQLQQIMSDTIQELIQKFFGSPELIPVLNGMLHRVRDSWIKIRIWSNSRKVGGKEMFRRKQIFNIYHARVQILLLFYERITGDKWITDKFLMSLRDFLSKQPTLQEESQDYTGYLE